jgi:hypothetical protein
MEKTAARIAYARFKAAKEHESKVKDDPVSKGKLLGTGISGGLFGPLGGGIAGAINAPEGKGWGSFGSGFGGGVAGALPGLALEHLSSNDKMKFIGKLLAQIGSGVGSAGAYHMYNAPEGD